MTEDELRLVIKRFEQRLAALELKPTDVKVQNASFTANEGQHCIIEAPVSPVLTATLPKARPQNRNERVTFTLRNANPVRFIAVDGLINGRSSGIMNLPGTFDAISDGLTGWAISVLAGGPGATGASGAQGQQGPQGIPGSDGADGADGRDGSPGIPGTPGATGPQGIPGNDGLDGSDGRDGVDGPPGAPGAPGTAGATGPQGPQGIPGNDGADGAQGEDGAPGVAGPAGAAGAPGATGPPGPQGIPGNDGADGKDGADGAPGTPAPVLTLSPGQFLGLNIDAAGNGPAVALTGAQGGQNLRRDSWVADTTSTGTVADYVIAETTTGVRFDVSSALTLAGISLGGAIDDGKDFFLTARSTSSPVTLPHESGSEATAARRFACPGSIAATLLPNETASILSDSLTGRRRIVGLARARSAVQANAGTISPAETLNFTDGVNTRANVAVATGVSAVSVDFRRDVTRPSWSDDFEYLFAAGNVTTAGNTFTTSAGAWSVATSASTATLGLQGPFTDSTVAAADGPDHPGFIKIDPNNITGNRIAIFKGGAGSFAGTAGYQSSRVLTFEGIFRISNLINTDFKFGMSDQILLATPTNGVYFQMNAGTITGNCRTGGVTGTTSGTFSPTASAWFYLRAEQVVVGTWAFFAGATKATAFSLSTISAHIPPDTARLTPYAEQSANLSSALTSLCDIDYIMFETQALNR